MYVSTTVAFMPLFAYKNATTFAKKDSNLIGQFGVGFYSSFMVADHVDVVSLKAGNKEAWKWSSDGKSGFEIVKDVKKDNGTVITLHLNDEGKEFANRWQIENLVKKYSDHIDFPIFLTYPDIEYDDEGKEKSRASKTDQINDAKAFWTRSPKEVKKKEYKEFYKSLSNDMEDPFEWVHFLCVANDNGTDLYGAKDLTVNSLSLNSDMSPDNELYRDM